MRQKHRQSGYTLIDLVLSLAIIGILSGIIVANLHRGKVYGDLVVGAQRLSNSVRQMQTFALNSRVERDECASGELCAWGVVFYSGQDYYRLFEDWFQKDNIQHRGRFNDQEAYQGPVVLPAGITIGRIRARNIAGDWDTLNDSANVTFLPPDPRILICGHVYSQGQCNYIELEITLTNGSDDRILNINKFGLIDVIQ